jgi:dipeptidase D
MVGEKNRSSNHDFDKDPIIPLINGDIVSAKNTTLGADNGIGLAAAMAVLEDKNLKHPPIEALFTVAEETGLIGAAALTPEFVTGRTLLNLDSEDWGEFCVGCAGGQRSRAIFPFEGININNSETYFLNESNKKCPYEITISHLCGGHSGVDIHEHRGNALKIAGLVLTKFSLFCDFEIIDIYGGSKDNAIPREAFIKISSSPNMTGSLQKCADELVKALVPGLHCSDANLKIQITESKFTGDIKLINSMDSKKLSFFLAAWPDGVAAMSNTIKGLVETSSNLAIVKTDKDKVHITGSARSSVDSSIEIFETSLDALAHLSGAVIEHDSKYPGWHPDMNSPILKKVKRIYTEKYGIEPVVSAIHAGLECGIIGKNIPDMDMISFGPDIFNPHCPDEKVTISSVQKFYDFLIHLLAS